MNKKGLGKGLKALIPTKDTHEADTGVQELNVTEIVRNQKQPRQDFDQEKLLELASSIKEHGIIQPVIVRKLSKDKFELIAGERRWRAAKIAGMSKIPAIIKEVSDKELTEMALIENIQREDLNPVEEAMAYKQLIEEFGLTQDELSKRVGKSRPFITNSLRLLNLPSDALKMVQQGLLTAGHARALLVIEKAMDQAAIAKKVIEKNMSVRQVEQLVRRMAEEGKHDKKPAKASKTSLLPIINDIEEQIQSKLGTRVKIRHGDKKGLIEIEYYGNDDLQRIIESILGDVNI